MALSLFERYISGKIIMMISSVVFNVKLLIQRQTDRHHVKHNFLDKGNNDKNVEIYALLLGLHYLKLKTALPVSVVYVGCNAGTVSRRSYKTMALKQANDDVEFVIAAIMKCRAAWRNPGKLRF